MRLFAKKVIRNFSSLTALLIWLAISSSNLSAQLSDDFSDGNLSQNPTWIGDIDLFQINVDLELQSNGSGSDDIFISTPSSRVSLTEWRITARMDAAPSGSNQIRIYLVADEANLEGPVNGYFIGMGESGSNDGIDLFRQDGNNTEKIIDGIAGTVGGGINVNLRITRDNRGNWEIFADPTGGMDFVSQGSVVDTSYITSNYFGILVSHTSTRAMDFFFDNIYVGDELPDTQAPIVTQADFFSDTEIDITFSEQINNTPLQNTANYSLNNGLGNPITINILSPIKIRLEFGNPFQNLTDYILSVSGMTDALGNTMEVPQEISLSYIILDEVSERDVVINEIMADPDPVRRLPNVEFIELYNRTDKVLDLQGWTIDNGTTIGNFPASVLLPGEYLILTDKNDASKLESFGKVISPSSWPSLVNGGDVISLFSAQGVFMDRVGYQSSWYRNTTKAQGGWTLERIDPNFIACDHPENWRSSQNDNGGTPGAPNSVIGTFTDEVAPAIEYVAVQGDTIELFFNEQMDESSLMTIENYVVDQSIGEPVFADPIGPTFRSVKLWLRNTMQVGTIYNLNFTNLQDCAGNSLSGTTQVGVPETPSAGDLLINEILFNPLTGGKDFVEIYNASEKVVDLSTIAIGEEPFNDTITNPYLVSMIPIIFLPQQFLCLTNDVAIQKEFYSPPFGAKFLEMSSFPSYANDEGEAIIFLPDTAFVDPEAKILTAVTLDQFFYQDDYHFPTLDDEDGVSLERISLVDSTQNPDNWHSASAVRNYATPGYENSQRFEGGQSSGQVSLEKETFSPDGDGVDDVLAINYDFDFVGANARISVFDAQGRLIRILHNNTLLGPDPGTFFWDGRNDNQQKATIGIYVILFEVTNQRTGDKEVYKVAAVLAGKF